MKIEISIIKSAAFLKKFTVLDAIKSAFELYVFTHTKSHQKLKRNQQKNAYFRKSSKFWFEGKITALIVKAKFREIDRLRRGFQRLEVINSKINQDQKRNHFKNAYLKKKVVKFSSSAICFDNNDFKSQTFERNSCY